MLIPLSIPDGCCHATIAELNSCDKNYMTQKIYKICYLAPNRKCLLNSRLQKA